MDGESALDIEQFGGPGFSNVSLKLRRGEIIGLAGIEANGQREFMRALAGLSTSSGMVKVNGKRVSIAGVQNAAAGGIVLVPGDRHREGIFGDLSVRDFSLRSIADEVSGGIVNASREAERARDAVRKFAVKTPGVETPIAWLSGGNQQKVVLAGALAASPTVLLVDEPTQGVDVATRMEIYKTLRESAQRGMAIIVLSADAQEVAGLSDRVMVFSRGQIVRMLSGAEVTENNITSAALKSTSVRDKRQNRIGAFWKWMAGDLAPIVDVACAILLMAAVATYENPYYLSARSLSGIMVLIATLAIVAYGQQLILLIGGIDLSVGPLTGLVQVIASFYLLPEMGTLSGIQGCVFILAAGVVVGSINWLLVDPLKLHPLVATLATFMGIQAVALMLRPIPEGLIDVNIMDAIDSRVGFVPVTMIVAVLIALALEIVLVRHGLGVALRGFGSKAEVARVAGIPPRRMRLVAYVGCSLLTCLAAVTLISQIGVGDPRAGLGYTLTSIAAAVIGGASLAGGRGSFVGVLFGAVFITQVNSVIAFLDADPAWQLYVLGAMILATVALYSKSRLVAAWS